MSFHWPFYIVVNSLVASNRKYPYITPGIIACQSPLSMGLPRQEYWSRLPLPSPGDLPNSGIEPKSPAPRPGGLNNRNLLFRVRSLRHQRVVTFNFKCFSNKLEIHCPFICLEHCYIDIMYCLLLYYTLNISYAFNIIAYDIIS